MQYVIRIVNLQIERDVEAYCSFGAALLYIRGKSVTVKI